MWTRIFNTAHPRSRGVPALLAALALSASCGPPKAIDAADVLANLDAHLGKRVVMRARFRSGARCHLESKEWTTYCKDCQYCRGPLVVDTGKELSEELDDWPMILGGTWEGQDIRCKGPLGKIECAPFVEGKTYVVQGEVENQRPPKLLVERFWEVE